MAGVKSTSGACHFLLILYAFTFCLEEEGTPLQPALKNSLEVNVAGVQGRRKESNDKSHT
jgi:hypothetical protein